ncbi:DUF3618 domain-containing protein [Bordetella tumulicola]
MPMTTQADRQALLVKMEHDRQELVRSFIRTAPGGGSSAAWVKTTALAAGAALGWPPFLKQPLRAMTAVALRDRFADLLSRRHTRRVSDASRDADIAELTKLTSHLRASAATAADPQRIEQLRSQVDEHVRRLRASRNDSPPAE